MLSNNGDMDEQVYSDNINVFDFSVNSRSISEDLYDVVLAHVFQFESDPEEVNQVNIRIRQGYTVAMVQ